MNPSPCWAGRWSDQGPCGAPSVSPTGLCPVCEARLEETVKAIEFEKGPP